MERKLKQIAGRLGAVVILSLIHENEAWRGSQARRAAQVADIIKVGIVAHIEIDAVIVAMWYAMAGAISMFVSGFIAVRFARFLIK